MITKVNLAKRCSMSIEVFAKRARELRKWSDINEEAMQITVEDNNTDSGTGDTKSRKVHYVTLTDKAKEYLRGQMSFMLISSIFNFFIKHLFFYYRHVHEIFQYFRRVILCSIPESAIVIWMKHKNRPLPLEAEGLYMKGGSYG